MQKVDFVSLWPVVTYIRLLYTMYFPAWAVVWRKSRGRARHGKTKRRKGRLQSSREQFSTGNNLHSWLQDWWNYFHYYSHGGYKKRVEFVRSSESEYISMPPFQFRFCLCNHILFFKVIYFSGTCFIASTGFTWFPNMVSMRKRSVTEGPWGRRCSHRRHSWFYHRVYFLSTGFLLPVVLPWCCIQKRTSYASSGSHK